MGCRRVLVSCSSVLSLWRYVDPYKTIHFLKSVFIFYYFAFCVIFWLYRKFFDGQHARRLVAAYELYRISLQRFYVVVCEKMKIFVCEVEKYCLRFTCF